MPLLSKNKAKIDPSKLRVERIVVDTPKPKPKPPSQSLHPPRPSSGSSKKLAVRHPHGTAAGAAALRTKSASPYPSSSDDRKRKITPVPKRKSPASDRITFDKDSDSDDDDGDWVSALDSRKRQRHAPGGGGRRVDENRALRQPRSFTEPDKELRFIDAAQLAFRSDKCNPVLGVKEDEVAVKLQYPSLHRRERFVPPSCWLASRRRANPSC